MIESFAAPREILDELARSIDRERLSPLSSSGLAGRKGFVGHIDGQRFRIQRRQENWNGFAPHAYGRVSARSGGAAIDYTISLHRTTKVGAIACFTFLGVIGLMTNFGTPVPSPGQLSPVLWTVLTLLAALALVLVGRHGWEGEVAALHRFISEVNTRVSGKRDAVVS